MQPWYDHGGVTLYHGNALEILQSISEESVNCCVTSPPYWGLRDYGIPKTVWGGDRDHEHIWGSRIITNGTNHVDKRRWNHTRNGRDEEQPVEKRVGWKREDVEQGQFCECGAWLGALGLEPTPQLFTEHLVILFEEVRRVLRPDGILWLNIGDSYCSGNREHYDQVSDNKGKRGTVNLRPPMPSGLKPKDLVGIPWRVAFALQEAGWWLRQDIIWAKPAPMPESVTDRCTKAHEYLFLLAKNERYYFDSDSIREPFATDPRENYPARAKVTGRGEQGFADARGGDRDKSGGFPPNALGRNKRSVWTINTSPTPDAHFATFPEDLVRPCILSGCPDGGIVLDPFSGSSTTALVAKESGRRAIGIDLNEDYLRISERRLQQDVLAF